MEKIKRLLARMQVPCWTLIPALTAFSEIMLYLWTNEQFSLARFAAVAAFALGFGTLLAFLCSLLPPKVGKWTGLVLTLLWTVLCMAEYFIHDAFHSFMAVETMLAGAGGVAGTFMDTVTNLLLKDLWRILLMLLPIAAYILLGQPSPAPWKSRGILAGAAVLGYLAGLGIVNLAGTDQPVLSTQYSFDGAIRSFGLNMAMVLEEVNSGAIGGNELEFEVIEQETAAPTEDTQSAIPDETAPEETEPPVVYGEHTLGLDFSALAEEQRNSTISSMHSYIASLTPTSENEYTGLFAGKNLIFITAEAFTAQVIDPELTPTLYRLATQGIQFTDYYQPAWGAGTTGGEFANVVGMVPNDGSCMKEARSQDLFLTIGSQLQSQGYSSASFHNNDYKYYDRNLTHTYLGYDYFMGYGNGIEEGVSPGWPKSDLEMMEFTVPMYIDQQPFSVYYMSVSGHSIYHLNSNSMSKKNYDRVADLDYSEAVKCYLACQLEFEDAMTCLLAQLEEAGILDDTVIVIASDHYPYGLDKSNTWSSGQDYLTELFGEECNNVFVRDQNRLIIWSGCIEGMDIVVDEPTFSLDILPTISNLFGVEYDSRLFPGRDALSDEEAIIFWPNYSWKTELGTYLATTRTFTPAEGVEVEEGYVERISAIVRNRIKYAKNVSYYDYFNYVSDALEALNEPETEPTE